MTESMFDELLTRRHGSGTQADPEACWDSRAEEFSRRQRKGGSDFAGRTVSYLQDKNVLTSGTVVLEIGCGAGRYTIPVAATAQEVVATDISSRMLSFMEKNAGEAGLHNIKPVKIDWREEGLAAPIQEKSYDLVFGVMCPGIRSKKAIDKMTLASRGYCMMGQLILMKDNLTGQIREELGIPEGFDPHNDRERAMAVFNLLWLQGLNPEVSYLDYNHQGPLPLEEALRHVEARLRGAGAGHSDELRAAVSKRLQDGHIEVSSRSTMALISWKVT